MKTRNGGRKTATEGRRAEDRGLKTETGGKSAAAARRAAICRALVEAHGRCPFACGSRATGRESPGVPRCCAHCVYASLMRDGDRTLPICANTPAARGEIVRIEPDGVCPRFRAAAGPVVRCRPPRPRKKGIRYIPLTKNKFAIVDRCDYERLAQFKWCVSCTGRRKLYACRMVGRTLVRMHREIMQAPKGMVVDHIDGNSLNNCRTNLRICTYSQNLCNRQKYRGATPYKGVFYRKDRDKYYARIKFEGTDHYLGLYDDPIDAAKAYDRRARELHGPYARLNFPDEAERSGVGAEDR
jgi:hypothetical protein